MANQDNYWLRKQKMSRRTWLRGSGAAVAGASALALVGCGDDDTSSNSTVTNTPAAAGGSGTAVATATAAPEGKPGGELRVAVDRDPVSLDPHIEASYRTMWAIGGAYNRVLGLSSDLVIGPELAASREQSDDTTLLLHVQPGVKFQDMAPVSGRAMTADDIKYSIDRIRTNKPEFQRQYMFEAIDSMTVVDPATLKIKLKQPFAPLLAYLANPFTCVAPKELVDSAGDLRTQAIGTGPFMLKEVQKGVSYKSVRNPTYWEKNRPYLDAYTLSVVPDDSSRVSAFQAKQLDMEIMTPDAANGFKNDSSVALEQSTQGGWFSLRFNCTKPPFNDPRVRKAFDLCLDRKQIIDLTLGGVGSQMGPIAPGLAEWAMPDADLMKRPGYRSNKDQDIADAKKLLEQTGNANTEFEYLFYTPAAINEQVAVVVQQQLQKAGIKVKLNKQEYAAWIPLTLQKNYQVTGTSSGFRDNPDEYLYALFFSTASRNDTGYNNPDMDKELELQRTQLDESARKKTVLDLQAKLLDEVPNSWIYTETVMEPRYKYVKGYDVTYAHNRTREFVRAWFDK
jgi:peptide/nickel transport system substrate-binding protein